MKIALDSAYTFMQVTTIRLKDNLETPNSLQNQLIDSCVKNHIHILKCNLGNLIGYVAWASITRETLNICLKMSRMPIYSYERYDGKIILIYDVVFSKEYSGQAKNSFFQFLGKKRLFAYFKNKKITVCSKIRWKHRRIELCSEQLIKTVKSDYLDKIL
jgi:hypothetical protein